jgi:hypothetical protein
MRFACEQGLRAFPGFGQKPLALFAGEARAAQFPAHRRYRRIGGCGHEPHRRFPVVLERAQGGNNFLQGQLLPLFRLFRPRHLPLLFIDRLPAQGDLGNLILVGLGSRSRFS